MYGQGHYGGAHFPPPPPPPLRPPNPSPPPPFQNPPYPQPAAAPPHFFAPPAPSRFPPPAMPFLPPPPPSGYAHNSHGQGMGQGMSLPVIPPPQPPAPGQGMSLQVIPPPPPPALQQALYRHPPPPPPPGIQHVPAPPPPRPDPAFAGAMPPPLPPPSPPPPPPASPPPPPPPSPPPAEEGVLGVSRPDDDIGNAGSEEDGDGAPAGFSPPPMKPDDEVVRSIETLCRFISKVGMHFESLAQKKEAGNPQFAFLFGGEPGSAAAIGYEYFQWMKRKCLSEGSDHLGNRLEERKQSPRVSEDCGGASSAHADSDMDMEDDDDDADGQPDREIDHTDMKIPFYAHEMESHPIPDNMMSQLQPDISDKKKVFEDMSDLGRSVTQAASDKVLLSFPGNGAEGATSVFVKNGSPFRHIQDYASDESSGDDLGNCFISDVSPVRASPTFANLTSTSYEETVVPFSDQGDEDAPKLELQIDKQLDIPPADMVVDLLKPTLISPARTEQTSPHDFVSSPDKEAGRYHSVDRFDTKDEVLQEFQKHDFVKGIDGHSNYQVGPDLERICTKENPAVRKVDEFGRMVREGVRGNESGGSPSKKWHGKRARNWSRSPSPSDGRRSPRARNWSRSPSPFDGRRSPRARNWNRSPSPSDGRRSPSARRRSDKRNRSRSSSPKRRWRRSNSPTECRRMNEFVRRERGDPPRCIHFMRGRCRRGSFCRFLHVDSREQWAKPRQHHAKLYDSDTHARDHFLVKDNDSCGSMPEETGTVVECGKSSLEAGTVSPLPLVNDSAHHSISVVTEDKLVDTDGLEKVDENGFEKVSCEDTVVVSGPAVQSPGSVGAIHDQSFKEEIQHNQSEPDSESNQQTQKEENSVKLDEGDPCPVQLKSPQSQVSLHIDERENGSPFEHSKPEESSALEPFLTTTSPPVENHNQVSHGQELEDASVETAQPTCGSFPPGDVNEPIQTFEVHVSSDVSLKDQKPHSDQVSSSHPSARSIFTNELPPSGFPGSNSLYHPSKQNLPPSQQRQPLHQPPFTPVATVDHFPLPIMSQPDGFHSMNEPPKASWATFHPPHFVDSGPHATTRTDNYQPQFSQRIPPFRNDFPQNDVRQRLHGDPNHPGPINISQPHGYGGPSFSRDGQFIRSPLVSSQNPQRFSDSYQVGFANNMQDTHPSFRPLGFNKPPGPVMFPAESSLRAPPPVYSMQHSSDATFSFNQNASASIYSSVLKRPLNFPEKHNEPWAINAPSISASSTAPHYNPFASTFEVTRGPRHSLSFGQPPFEHWLVATSVQPESVGVGPSIGRSGAQVHAPTSGIASYHSYMQDPMPPISSVHQKQQYLEPSSRDQYDPLLDSLETSNVLKTSDYTIDKREDVAYTEKGLNTSTFPVIKINKDAAETTVDAEVGTVENDRPVLDADDFPNPAFGELDVDKIASPEKSPGKSRKGKDSKSMKNFKLAIANFVKEILKPSWHQGNMSKEAFKTIVKKTVEKVSSTIPVKYIPKTQAKIDHYVQSSQRKLIKLVNGYVEKYVKM